jgi:hypothetical protein
LGHLELPTASGADAESKIAELVQEHPSQLNKCGSGQTVPKEARPTAIGDGLRSQTDGRQATEVSNAANVLNYMLELGRPEDIRIA